MDVTFRAPMTVTFRAPMTVHFHGIERVEVNDYRNDPRPFVSLRASGDKQGIALYLPADLARQLHHQLGKLFPGDDVVGTFEAWFGRELTVNNLDELKGELNELRPYRRGGIPAPVGPVKGI